MPHAGRPGPLWERLLVMASDSEDSHVTVGGVTLGTRRRVVVDLALLVTVFGCIAGFMDMRAQTKAQTEAFRALSHRLDAVEARERTMPSSTATKADIDRIDRRLDRLQELLIESARR